VRPRLPCRLSSRHLHPPPVAAAAAAGYSYYSSPGSRTLYDPLSRPRRPKAGFNRDYAPARQRIILTTFAVRKMSTTTTDRFSWNAGGLAGTAVGASLWMPATALASGWPAIGVAAAFAMAFLILVSACVLWWSRQRVSAFGGLMVLLAVGFVATLLFLVAAQVLDLSLLDGWPGGKRGSPRSYAWVLLLYPVLASWFWLQNRQTGNSEPGAAPNGGPAMRPDNSGASGGPPSVS
jgi:hypothetical protein